MLCNRKIGSLVLLAISASSAHSAAALEPCPARHGNPLVGLQVYDGTAAEMASLVPDNEEGSGPDWYWTLGYVYDSGRFVTVSCGYADKTSTDVVIEKRVRTCTATQKHKGPLSLSCK
jgi:hypothetical protein